jgi:hypothetical protein
LYNTETYYATYDMTDLKVITFFNISYSLKERVKDEISIVHIYLRFKKSGTVMVQVHQTMTCYATKEPWRGH